MSTGKIGGINSKSCQVKSSFEVNPAASSWPDLRQPEVLPESSRTLHQSFLTCLLGGIGMSKCLAIKLKDRKTLRFITLLKALVQALTYLWQLWAWDSREITVICCQLWEDSRAVPWARMFLVNHWGTEAPGQTSPHYKNTEGAFGRDYMAETAARSDCQLLHSEIHVRSITNSGGFWEDTFSTQCPCRWT